MARPINPSQVSLFPEPPYETWYVELQEKFDTASLARKRKMLFKAIMFAGHSASNQVKQCELDYSAWVVSNYNPNYRPSFCPSRWEWLQDSAMQYLSTLADEWFDRDKWLLVEDLSRNVRYLGAVKACFALALVGYNLACLDTHGMQGAGYSIAEANVFYRITNPKKRKDAIETYRAYHDAIFPEDARRAQWSFFREEPTFRATGHRTYFLSQGIAC